MKFESGSLFVLCVMLCTNIIYYVHAMYFVIIIDELMTGVSCLWYMHLL